MPFALNKTGVISDIKLGLNDSVTQALVTAQENEQEDGQLLGQIIAHRLEDQGDDCLMEINANVNNNDGTGQETFVLTMRKTSTKPRASQAKTAWNPTMGPLTGLKSSTPAPTDAPATPVVGATDAQAASSKV